MNRSLFRKRRRKIKLNIKAILILLIFLYILSLILASFNMDKIKADIIKNEASKLFYKASSESVAELSEYLKDLEESDGGYFAKSSDLNLLKASLSAKLNRNINKTVRLFLPSGNFTGVYLLEGIGFPVPISISFIGNAKISFSESFETAGVNQTVYELKLIIEAEMNTASLKFSTEQINLTTEYILAERIIIGEVPNFYNKG